MISHAVDGPWPAAHQRYSLSFAKRFSSQLLGMACAGVRIVNKISRKQIAPDRTVILMEPFGMGDVIALMPLLEVLHRAGWKVAILAKGTWKELVPNEHFEVWMPVDFPWASYIDSKKYRSLRGVLDLLAQIRMRLGCFSGAIGIDPRGDVRSIFFLRLLGCRDVVSMDHYTGSTLGVSRVAARIAIGKAGDKRWQEILGVCPWLGIDATQTGPHLDFPQFATAETIAVLPVAPWAGKLWPAESWQELLRWLNSENRHVIALCGPGQSAEACHFVGTQIEIFECTTVGEWVERLQKVRLLVTVDTGPMHLASAMGVPVVALFGVTPLPLWAPSGRKSLIVHPQDDADFKLCQQIEANVAHGDFWINRVRPVEVIEACKRALTEPSAG